MYGDTKESLPYDISITFGNPIVMKHNVDINPYHDILTRRAVTGILHFLTKTSIDWFLKKQANSEIVTYGFEFVAAQTCVKQIVDLGTTLRYLGARIIGSSYMLGDNKSMF